MNNNLNNISSADNDEILQGGPSSIDNENYQRLLVQAREQSQNLQRKMGICLRPDSIKHRQMQVVFNCKDRKTDRSHYFKSRFHTVHSSRYSRHHALNYCDPFSDACELLDTKTNGSTNVSNVVPLVNSGAEDGNHAAVSEAQADDTGIPLAREVPTQSNEIDDYEILPCSIQRSRKDNIVSSTLNTVYVVPKQSDIDSFAFIDEEKEQNERSPIDKTIQYINTNTSRARRVRFSDDFQHPYDIKFDSQINDDGRLPCYHRGHENSPDENNSVSSIDDDNNEGQGCFENSLVHLSSKNDQKEIVMEYNVDENRIELEKAHRVHVESLTLNNAYNASNKSSLEPNHEEHYSNHSKAHVNDACDVLSPNDRDINDVRLRSSVVRNNDDDDDIAYDLFKTFESSDDALCQTTHDDIIAPEGHARHENIIEGDSNVIFLTDKNNHTEKSSGQSTHGAFTSHNDESVLPDSQMKSLNSENDVSIAYDMEELLLDIEQTPLQPVTSDSTRTTMSTFQLREPVNEEHLHRSASHVQCLDREYIERYQPEENMNVGYSDDESSDEASERLRMGITTTDESNADCGSFSKESEILQEDLVHPGSGINSVLFDVTIEKSASEDEVNTELELVNDIEGRKTQTVKTEKEDGIEWVTAEIEPTEVVVDAKPDPHEKESQLVECKPVDDHVPEIFVSGFKERQEEYENQLKRQHEEFIREHDPFCQDNKDMGSQFEIAKTIKGTEDRSFQNRKEKERNNKNNEQALKRSGSLSKLIRSCSGKDLSDFDKGKDNENQDNAVKRCKSFGRDATGKLKRKSKYNYMQLIDGRQRPIGENNNDNDSRRSSSLRRKKTFEMKEKFLSMFRGCSGMGD